jgi:ribose/xylose/arabinose/galactoside ABC-type transport system permease subunit
MTKPVGDSTVNPKAASPTRTLNLPPSIREIVRPLVGLLLILALMFILAPTFRQWTALEDILENSAVLFIMASGVTVVLISGGLDLSIGAILALVSVVTGSLLIANVPVWAAILGGLAAGAFCGMMNGLIIIKTGIPTLIATLGTQLIIRGFANMIGTGLDMSRFPPAFRWLGAGFVGPAIISLISFVVIWFMLSKTKLGFQAYAIGGNEEVARLSGIPVNFDKVIYYTIGGLMAGLAAIVQTSRLDFATVNRGQGMELWAIAAVVIGGTSMFGGIGGVGKTVIGVLIIRVLEAGLIHLHVPSFWQQVATGAVVIIAVWLDYLQRRARERA